MRKIQARLLLSAAGAIMACAATPAFAADQDSPATVNDTGNVDDIVVTARRRAEKLTDVPVSVTVLSGASLSTKGIVRVDDLQTATPGLKMAPTAGRRSNSQYELRGITTIESLITEDPAVGIYVDDVYRARATGTNQSFFDIANVQVLYGPQGTLFGRNSTGGAILISSNRPTDRFEGSLEGGYGSLNQYTITGMINVPLSDALQVRLAGQRVKADGYVLNGTSGNMLGGKDSWSGRASIHFKPSDTIDNQFVASYYTANDGGTPNVIYGFRSSTTPNEYGQVPALAPSAFAPLVAAALAAERAAGFRTTYLDGPGATIPLAGGGSIPLAGPGGTAFTGYSLQGSVLSNRDPYEKPRNFSISNTTVIELSDSISLKNIIGYNYTHLEASTDLDGTPLKLIDTYYRTSNHQISDEIQLSGKTSRFNWVLGGLYFRESGSDLQPAVQFVQSFGTSTLHGINTSVGVFAQGTYKLTDQLSLTGGGRYTWDKRDARFSDMVGSGGVPLLLALGKNGGLGTDVQANAVCMLKAGVANDGPCGIHLNKSFAEPSYTVSLDYKPNADTLLYVAHRHGYRAGGFNSRVTLTANAAQQLSQLAPFQPEKINDVEVGFKGNYRIGDVRVRGNIAVYQSWYTNIQKQTTQFINGTGVTLIQNSGRAKVKGVEAQFGISPVRGFDIDTFFAYVDGKYHDFPAPNSGVVATVPFATAKVTAGVNFTMTPVDDVATGKVSVVANYSYRSDYYGDNALPTLNPEAHVPAQHNVNLALNWDNVSGSPFSASAWVRNATNQLRILGAFDLVPSFGVAVASIGEPRTYGFTLKYKFGG